MRILVADLSNIFWTIALAGSANEGTAARDFSLKDIRESAAGHDRIVVAIDGDDRLPSWPQAPWRRSIWPSYKSGREERSQASWALLHDTIRHCESEGWTVLRSPPMTEPNPDDDGRTDRVLGYHEADDVIGSVFKWCRLNGHELTIRSGDSDLSQCTKDDAPIVQLMRKVKGQRISMDCAAVKEWQKVPPHWIAPLKALAGDVGDGYGGKDGPYPGIGTDTAIPMLIAANGDAIKAVEMAIASERLNKDGRTIPKEIQICRKLGTDPVKRALRLARLVFDLPLDFAAIVAPVATKAPPSLPAAARTQPLTPAEVQEVEFVDEQVIRERNERRSSPVALAIVEPPRMHLAPMELMQRDREIDALIKHTLRNGPPDGVSDYGVIPYCGNKPALFDVGAERLAKVFAIYPKFKVLKEILQLEGQSPFVLYMVRCRLFQNVTDKQVGETNAVCTSGEKGFLAQKKPIHDLIHPVFARAQKRAFVKAVLRATGAQKYLSSGFDDLQDAEFGQAPDAPQWEQK